MGFFSPLESEYYLYEIPNQKGTPERNLLVAVLERALLDYVGNDTRERDAARQWLFAEKKASETSEEFSLSWICHQLDLDIDEVLSKVRDMPQRGNQRIAPWYFNRQLKPKLISRTSP